MIRTNLSNTEKKAYFAPQVETILVDNEISLQLSSAFGNLPGDPGSDCVEEIP